MAPLLPTLTAHARSFFLSRGLVDEDAPGNGSSALLRELGPLAARSVLASRDDGDLPPDFDPSKGVVAPHEMNQTGIFVLFGLIGAAFVVAGIWFFFWARNGGFYFKENDWEDYKSTVLRRKGPNGTLLSGATPSTDLGGGSVYKDVDDGETGYFGRSHAHGRSGRRGRHSKTEDTRSVFTGITGGVSDIAGRERRRRRREKKEREQKEKEREKEDEDHHSRHRSRHRSRQRGGRRVGEDGALVDEEAEAEAQDHLRAYRHEKPARVGGINKERDGSEWEGSTNHPDNSTVAGSEASLLGNRQATPTGTPTRDRERGDQKKGGIRKVYSAADRTADRESERGRAEARRLQEKGRASTSAAAGGGGGGVSRRDFSFQRATTRAPPLDEEESTASSHVGRSVPGSWTDDGSDLGTKSYRHVIPGLGGGGGGEDYAEEKRKRRGGAGYRRE